MNSVIRKEVKESKCLIILHERDARTEYAVLFLVNLGSW